VQRSRGLNFGSLAEAGIVMLSLPFALVGGVWLMWLLDYNMSVATAIGFISLAGLAAETGVIMLIYLDHAYADLRAEGRALRPGRYRCRRHLRRRRARATQDHDGVWRSTRYGSSGKPGALRAPHEVRRGTSR
jgi:hypothetical protein